MKNKKDTKLYMGIIGLAKTTAGMNCEYGDYQDIKQYFRYPGELLERMEEQGFTSTEDYISVMKGLTRIEKYHTDGTFIGSQLEDFLQRAKEKAVKEHNLILLYQVLTFQYCGSEPAAVSGESEALLLTSVEKSSLEETFEFLSLFFEKEKDSYWKKNPAETVLIKKILEVKIGQIMNMTKIPVMGNDAFYMTVISFFHDLKLSILRDDPRAKLEVNFGKDLGQIISVFSALYEEAVKGKNEKFLKNLGYTEMDILHLNAGIWFLNNETTYLQRQSDIKWWRLLKRWFQELFHQETEIPFADSLKIFVREYFDSKKMPQKIDGENIIREFLLKGFQPGVPNVRNSYLLFDLLTMKIGDNYRYDVYNAQNQVPLWDELNGTHKLSASRKEEEEWLRGLVKYLYPEGIKKESNYGSALPVLPKRLVRIYAHVLQEYIVDQKKLEEKGPVLGDIFDQDVKEFLYQQASYFTPEQLHLLFESGYLDFSEFVKINYSRESREYLREMDRPYLLAFLKDFCESRNWMFTEKEADYLKKAMEDSWVISIAYHKTDKPVLFHKFSGEECETMLGLICELITRIPDICPLSDLMAGFISNEQSRKIIGEEICAKWYKALEARNYNALNVLRQDYLSEKEYEEYVQKKKELEEEKRKNKERENLKAIREKLDAELNGLSDAERLDLLSKKMPSYVSGYSKDLTVIAILDAYRNLRTMVPVTKKVFRKCINFFLECYGSDYITRKEFMDFASKLMEETKNE